MAAVNAYGSTEGSGRYPGSSAGTNGHVGFNDTPDSTQDREKYLTAKYPKKTMNLIRKRIAVEYFVDNELRQLYGVSEDGMYDCEVDLDELLDIDEERERRLFLQQKVVSAKQSPEVVNKFITVVLEKVITL